MTTPAVSRAGSLTARAGQVRAGHVLDWTVTAVFTAIGWIAGTLWFCAVMAVLGAFRYCAEPAAWGFRAGAHRQQPDEKKPGS